MEISGDMQYWISSYGWIALFVLSFIAATIVPLSSEAALLGGIAAGIPVSQALIACSAGNCLACLVNYALGWFIREKLRTKLEASRSGRTAIEWMRRYGIWSLLLSWLPIVGDPLTIVAGLGRVSLVLFIPIVWTLRIVRYIVLVQFV